MGEYNCSVDGDGGDGDGDGDGNNDNVGGMTGMAVLSQTEGVGGEDNNGCGVSRTFFLHIFTQTVFHTDSLVLSFQLVHGAPKTGTGKHK